MPGWDGSIGASASRRFELVIERSYEYPTVGNGQGAVSKPPYWSHGPAGKGDRRQRPSTWPRQGRRQATATAPAERGWANPGAGTPYTKPATQTAMIAIRPHAASTELCPDWWTNVWPKRPPLMCQFRMPIYE